MTANADVMFRTICDERGGVDAMSAVSLAIARALASALTSDPLVPSTIAQLTALLPQPAKSPEAPPQGRPWDLSLLSDHQLRLLERLACIATGEAPPMVEHRPKSSRHWAAVDLARMCDAAQARDGRLTEDELVEVRNAVLELLYPMCLPARLWECYLPAPAIPPPLVEENAQAAVPESTRSVPAAGNVVPIRPDYNAVAPIISAPHLDVRKSNWPVQ
jgi:hypothetical protein